MGIGAGHNNFTIAAFGTGRGRWPTGASATAHLHGQGGERNSVTGAITGNRAAPGVSLGYLPRTWNWCAMPLVAVNKGGTGTRVFMGAPYTSGRQDGHRPGREPGPERILQRQRRSKNTSATTRCSPRSHRPKTPPSPWRPLWRTSAGAAHAAPIAQRVFDYWLMGEYATEDIAAVQRGQAGAPIGKPRKDQRGAAGGAMIRRWLLIKIIAVGAISTSALPAVLLAEGLSTGGAW